MSERAATSEKPSRADATDRRRREILAAALACFTEKGFAATTLADIRARSGASTGSIYHLFAGKDEIAGAVYLDGLGEYHARFVAAVTEAPDAEQAVRRCVIFHLAWVEDHQPLARFLATTRQTELLPAVRDELRQQNRVFFRSLRDHLAPYVDRGVVRSLPWELFVAVVAGPAHEHARAWLSGRSRLSPRDASPWLADAAWGAVRGETAASEPYASGASSSSARRASHATTSGQSAPPTRSRKKPK